LKDAALQTRFQSEQLEVADSVAAIELFFERGWTDGLPIVPPTPEAVEEMLEYAGHEPGTHLGSVPERRRDVTVEKVAVNAVMAGCLPAFLPVVLTAVEAILEPRFSLVGPSSNTAGAAVLIVVNGPVARQLGLNSKDNLFGPGNRANATIGRAVRLTMINAMGTAPGVFDQSCMGHPGKYTYCIAENEADSPWEPLHVDRGLHPEDSAVTVYAAQAMYQSNDRFHSDPESLLTSIALSMAAVSSFLAEAQPEMAVVVGYEHMQALGDSGWTRRQIKDFLFAQARSDLTSLKQVGKLPGATEPGDEARFKGVIDHADDILLVAAGGVAGRYTDIIPGWPGARSRSVTRAIGQCDECHV
jgi:hypothetical protein